MRIINFAKTMPALLAGRKTCTRRVGTSWLRCQTGELLQAWNHSPRVVRFNPHQVAVIRLTLMPYSECIWDTPDDDYEAEGFSYLDEHPELPCPWPRPLRAIWDGDRGLFWNHALVLTVVRFEPVELMGDATRKDSHD